MLFSAAKGGIFNGVSAALNGRNFWTGKPPVPKYDISIVRGLEPGNVSINTELTNDKLVSEAAIRADRNVPSTGNLAVDGILKHKYAERFIKKFQGIYGKRGLETNVYFNDQELGLRGFLDVKDEANKLIYDYKFGKAMMSAAQALKYNTAYPGYIINIVNKDGVQYIRLIIPK